MKWLSTVSPSWASPRGDMSEATFNSFRILIYEHSGISLGNNKQPLIKARIQKRMRTLGILAYSEYLDYVKEDIHGTELQELLDAISTNVTSFYRESHHFEFLRAAVNEWVEAGQKRLRIWSAACSTGEEPYTIAIELLETLRNRTVDAKILATDISAGVLQKCHRGEYSAQVVQPVPTALQNKYFSVMGNPQREARYLAVEKLRRMVYVRWFNLTDFPYAVSGPMDFVFCRNVMIYFDRPTRSEIVREFARIVKPGGYLFLGHSESLSGITSSFVGVRPSIYRRE